MTTLNRYHIEHLEELLKEAIHNMGYAFCQVDWQGAYEDLSHDGYCEGVADTLAGLLIKGMKAQYYIDHYPEGKAAYEAGKKAWQDERDADDDGDESTED